MPDVEKVALTERERAILFAPDRRMDAYYFGFEPTGVPAIDAILSAVANAGSGYHHTEDWDDEVTYRWDGGHSYVDVIQAAANEAASHFPPERPEASNG